LRERFGLAPGLFGALLPKARLAFFAFPFCLVVVFLVASSLCSRPDGWGACRRRNRGSGGRCWGGACQYVLIGVLIGVPIDVFTGVFTGIAIVLS